MSDIAKNTNKAVIKKFDAFCAISYVLVIVITTFFLWGEQADRSKIILKSDISQESYSDLLEVRSLDSTQVFYSNHQGNYPLVRVIQDRQANRLLMFVHPLWLILTSPFLLVASMCFAAMVFVARLLIYKSVNRSLTKVIALESWAYLSSIRGEIQPVPQLGPVSNAIKSIIEQLNDAKYQYGRADQRIREQALLDTETGVGNREFFTNRLEAVLNEEEARGAVLIVNFQVLEVVQSLYGYNQALAILESSISLLAAKMSYLPNYFMARRDGFEIAILVPGLYVKETEKLANKLLNTIDSIDFPVGINHDESCHIGIGYFTQDSVSYQIMAEADMALRSAQLQGPNQWFMYDTGEVAAESAKGSLKWRTFLTRAIENNAFVLFFQPVISSENNDILHHEVLSKVRDGHGKLISARVFLPMAQKCGLSRQVDTLVFDQTCRLLKYEKSLQDSCSLNLSIESLLSDEFISHVFFVLGQSPDIARKLIIEISEYHLFTNITKLSPILQFLNELGVRILADKVGQYVVSADYLRICPISIVKLHRSIVQHIQERLENQVFIQSIKTSCLERDVAIFALGVESKEEWSTLIKLGITGGQGHFFTEPVAQMANAIQMP